MIISCPYCGPRDGSEFTYQREGGAVRPDPGSTDAQAWNVYVYDRENIAGDRSEIWQHSGSCRALLRLTRNTLTHKISGVAFARETDAAKSPYVRKAKAEVVETTASPARKAPAKASAKAPAKPRKAKA